MDSLLVEQTFSPRKQIKNPKKKTHQILNNNYNNNKNNPHYIHQINSLNQNYAPPPQIMMHGGFFLNNHHTHAHAPFHHHHISNPMSLGVQQPPPPILPLPTVSKPVFRSLPLPIVPRKTPTKTKSLPKKENKKNYSVQFNSAKAEKTKGGPDPTDLTEMLLADLDKYSETVFKLAPPPSSLPLPKFYLRQLQQPLPPRKLSCSIKAATNVAVI